MRRNVVSEVGREVEKAPHAEKIWAQEWSTGCPDYSTRGNANGHHYGQGYNSRLIAPISVVCHYV